jgi:hypothetical protein
MLTPRTDSEAVELWRRFIRLLDIEEESDSGRAFHPNKISSCRALDGAELEEILAKAKQLAKPDYDWYFKVEEDHDGVPVMRFDASQQWRFHNLKLTFNGTNGKLKCAEVVEETSK